MYDARKNSGVRVPLRTKIERLWGVTSEQLSWNLISEAAFNKKPLGDCMVLTSSTEV